MTTPTPTVIKVLIPAGGTAIPGPQGAPGPQGPTGLYGQPRWSGQGPPPDTILGANPNDSYLDTLTGNIWTLE